MAEFFNEEPESAFVGNLGRKTQMGELRVGGGVIDSYDAQLMFRST